MPFEFLYVKEKLRKTVKKNLTIQQMNREKKIEKIKSNSP